MSTESATQTTPSGSLDAIKRTRIDWKFIKRVVIRDKWLYLMLMPFLAWYVVFEYYPMYWLQVAFKDYSLFRGISGSKWVGFDNFIAFMDSPYFLRNLKNTFMISFYQLLFAFPAPIILALLLNEVRNKLFKRTIQTLTYLPHFISVVIIAGIITNFLAPSNGLINIIIEKLGGQKHYFMMDPSWFRTILIGTFNIWKEVGFAAILYIAALSAINPELYEAAVIDGANKWKQAWHVTLPGIAPTIIIMLILRIGDLLSVGYETIILVYQPATYEVSDVISTYVYRSGLQEGKYDVAAAVGLFNAVVSIVLITIANRIARRVSDTSLW